MRRGRLDSSERGLSPVIGSTLLIAIAVLLITVSAVMFVSLTDETPPAPVTDIDLEPAGGGEYVLEMNGGDPLDGDRVRVQGIEEPEILEGEELTAGDSVRVEPTTDTVRITWHEDAQDGVSYSLHTFDVDLTNVFSSGTVFTTRSSGDLIEVVGDGGAVRTLVGTGDVAAIGDPGHDVTGDGQADLPFVTDSGEIKVTTPDGSTTTLADSADIAGSIATDKTRLAIGRWNGSDASVFFVNQNHDTIYRVPSSRSPVPVATPGDGAQSVVGVGDIDGDGTDELIFGDSSQTLQYIESDGTVQTTGVSTGSNNGIGTGTLADFDGDGQEEVAAVDGGNDIQLVDDSGGTEVSGTQAEKTPTAAADVDGDDDPELVYVGDGSGALEYLDNIGGTVDSEFLRDSDGNKIDGSDESGTA